MKSRVYRLYIKIKGEQDYQMYGKYRNQSKNASQKAVAGYQKSLSRDVKSNARVFFRYTKSKLNFKNAIPGSADSGRIISGDNDKGKHVEYVFQKSFYKGIILPSTF